MLLFANSNSKPRRPEKDAPKQASIAILGLAVALTALAGEPPTDRATFAAGVERDYQQAQRRFEADPTNVVAVCEFARAAFFRADYSTNDAERAAIAVQGIAACRPLLRAGTKSASLHYHLGLNLGQLARTRMISALAIVDEMEVEFKAARRLDPSLDFAGPDRTLGLLYLRAPTIGSVGSRTKARQHLIKAVELAPEFPDNQLNVIEALLRWNEVELARKQLVRLETLLPAARTNFTGEAWAASWLEWNTRLDAVRKRAKPK